MVSRVDPAKQALLEAVAATNRGREASPEQVRTIDSLASHLEALNPNPAPTAAPELLSGNWRTLYTTSPDLLRLDGLLPGLATGEIYQCVQAERGKLFNVAEMQGSGWLTALVPKGIVAVAATFVAQSERRVSVSFRRFVVGSQALMNYEIDSFLYLLEHKPEQLAALQFVIPPNDRDAWIEITYLDESLRIGRGYQGNLFVLEKVTPSEAGTAK